MLDVAGIALVGLDALAGFALGFRGRHDLTVHTELAQAPREDETGGAGFVAHIQFLEGHAEFFGQRAQGAFGGEIAAAAFAVAVSEVVIAGRGRGCIVL